MVLINVDVGDSVPLTKTDKSVRVKVRGQTRVVVREQYLRTDVHCMFSSCTKCRPRQGTSGTLLPSDLTHLIIPFMDIALKYLEILEFPEITGIIFPQTVVHMVFNEGGKKLYTRLCNVVRDGRKGSVVFANEFFKHVYDPRHAEESLNDWQVRNVYKVGVWYHRHLDRRMPVVMLTDCSDVIERYEHETEDVLLVSLGNYLKVFWPSLSTAFNIYESLGALLAVGQSAESSADYVEYLPVDVLELGLKMGRYHSGTLTVNKHYAQMEAFVSSQRS